MTLRTASLLLALLSSTAHACGPYEDDWAGRDKAAHFGVSAALGVATSQISSDPWTAFALALVFDQPFGPVCAILLVLLSGLVGLIGRQS